MVETIKNEPLASTLSTCYCSISSAIGSLYGSLHGGANERVVDMLKDIGGKDRVEGWINKAFGEKQKIMGMGHRVYKVKDPRADIMEAFLIQLSEQKKDFHYYEILKEIERVVHSKIENSDKAIYPNVDFFSGAVYLLLGISPILFTPIFAMARVTQPIIIELIGRERYSALNPRSIAAGFPP